MGVPPLAKHLLDLGGRDYISSVAVGDCVGASARRVVLMHNLTYARYIVSFNPRNIHISTPHTIGEIRNFDLRVPRGG